MGDWPLFLGRRAELRRRAVDALGLQGGEGVLELACGPGVNFPLLERAIGPSGKLTALDDSKEMLAAARQRAGARAGGTSSSSRATPRAPSSLRSRATRPSASSA